MRHLHIVCTDPCANGLQVVVSVTTWTNNLCDPTCILQAHEHPFLRHQSWVIYRKTQIEPATALDNGVAQGIFQALAPMNGQTFLRIRNGICVSTQTPKKIKKYMGCPQPQPQPVEANAGAEVPE